MSTKIVNCKFVEPSTQISAMDIFKAARTKGLSREEAAKLTIWALHRNNMGGVFRHVLKNKYPRRYPGWQTGAVSKEALETFDRLMVKPLDLQGLGEYDRKICNYLIVKKGKNAECRGVFKKAAILLPDKKLSEKFVKMLLDHISPCGLTPKQVLRISDTWVNINKGRDLFWENMGSYDISKVIDLILPGLVEAVSSYTPRIRWAQKRIGEYPMNNDEEVLYEGIPSEWNVATARMFSAMGYLVKKGGNEVASNWHYQFEDLHGHVPKWLIHWYHKDFEALLNLMPRSDEVVRAARSYLGSNITMAIPSIETHPRTVLRNLDRLNETLWASRSYKSYPKDAVYEQSHIAKYNIDGTWCELRSIKDHDELVLVANKLHNCAAGYHDEIAAGTSKLIAVWKGDDPVALAEVQGTEIIQLQGVHHTAVSNETKLAMLDYVRIMNGMNPQG